MLGYAYLALLVLQLDFHFIHIGARQTLLALLAMLQVERFDVTRAYSTYKLI
jgi:hypothetical protein